MPVCAFFYVCDLDLVQLQVNSSDTKQRLESSVSPFVFFRFSCKSFSQPSLSPPLSKWLISCCPHKNEEAGITHICCLIIHLTKDHTAFSLRQTFAFNFKPSIFIGGLGAEVTHFLPSSSIRTIAGKKGSHERSIRKDGPVVFLDACSPDWSS